MKSLKNLTITMAVNLMKLMKIIIMNLTNIKNIVIGFTEIVIAECREVKTNEFKIQYIFNTINRRL